MSMSKVCRKSGAKFSVSEDDLRFYERISPAFEGKIFLLPPPTLCPELRAMRRMAWRNSNHLYRRTCDKTGASIVSGFPPDAPYTVYGIKTWWGDDWDSLASGREFDFSRTFFEQFKELLLRSPRPALMNRDPDNSDYCNYAGQNKNCYMANNGSWYNENCLFGEAYLRCRDSVDCHYLRKCELCYEVIGGEGLYDCSFLVDSYFSSNCHFSFNLRSCTDCFLCSNLRSKSNYIRNKPALKEEIAALRETMKSQQGKEQLWAEFAALRLESIHPAVHHTSCEFSTGDYLTNCKNVHFGFMVGNVEDGKYLLHCDEAKDVWDCSLTGYENTELYYETVSSGASGSRARFCSGSWSSSDVLYCDTVMSCKNCFGCSGLKRQEYCILNRRYSKGEYDKLVPRIIEHMCKTGEWGEYFPEEIAPHAYNECHANDFYPLKQAEAQKLGYKWRDEPPVESSSSSAMLPENIAAISEKVCTQLFSCEATGKQYRIVPLELSLLQRMGIAHPRLAPET